MWEIKFEGEVRKSFYEVLWQEWQQKVCNTAVARKKTLKKTKINTHYISSENLYGKQEI